VTLDMMDHDHEWGMTRPEPTPESVERHVPEPSDICSVCGNGLVHIDATHDPATPQPARGDLREAQMKVVGDWFEEGHESGRMEYAVLLDRLAALRDTAPSGLDVALDLDSFIAGLDSPNHSDESRRAWCRLFFRDMQRAATEPDA
jgi:hypothetical protein